MKTAYDDVNFDQSEVVQRETHPAGIVKAVCVDIIDLPDQENKFYDANKPNSQKTINKIRLVWETAKRKADGKSFTISRFFSKSLYDGSNGGNASELFKVLSSWFGVDYDGRFEARKVAGRPALLVITHEAKDGGIKAKIANVLPDDTGASYVADGSYKRFVPKDDDGVPF